MCESGNGDNAVLFCFDCCDLYLQHALGVLLILIFPLEKKACHVAKLSCQGRLRAKAEIDHTGPLPVRVMKTNRSTLLIVKVQTYMIPNGVTISGIAFCHLC